jgi:hypothetical protein
MESRTEIADPTLTGPRTLELEDSVAPPFILADPVTFIDSPIRTEPLSSDESKTMSVDPHVNPEVIETSDPKRPEPVIEQLELARILSPTRRPLPRDNEAFT